MTCFTWKGKWGLWDHHSVSQYLPVNNFWTNWYSFMKFGRVVSLNKALKPYFLISYLQSFQNRGRSNFRAECKTCISQCGTMKFCVVIYLQRISNFKQDLFCEKQKNTNVVVGLKVKLHTFFYGVNRWTVALIVRQLKNVAVKYQA
jgi:hypothetical protein